MAETDNRGVYAQKAKAEQAVRKLARRVLEAQGYRVLEGPDGRQGLETFQKNQDSIDGVILDLNMPGMSGRTVLTKIIESSPDARVIISTGQGDAEVEQRPLAPAKAYLSKPYDAAELARKVRQVLDLQELGEEAIVSE